jgi:hypothetical protein
MASCLITGHANWKNQVMKPLGLGALYSGKPLITIQTSSSMNLAPMANSSRDARPKASNFILRECTGGLAKTLLKKSKITATLSSSERRIWSSCHSNQI